MEFVPNDTRAMAQDVSNALATVGRDPDRVQCFAALPTPDSERFVEGLKRGVTKLSANGALMFGRVGRALEARPLGALRGTTEQLSAMAFGVASATNADLLRFGVLHHRSRASLVSAVADGRA
ncbi:hypothetical protein [Sphingomonas lenta]|uniref:Uncharacterized protein n=1 Tax=Sphingomonas lenta TaxID=1141887 RepID=A0A2A2SCL4_9SPHN|nr:hypothetical protein [Sphingomonas lenta]PAX06953.1 hypothetical protein CKY28_12860 [Sphingomonas lenta]